MALRLRRVLSLSSSLLHIHSPKLTSQLHFISPSFPATTLNDQNPVTPFSSELLSFRHFRSSSISLSYREGGVRGRSDLDDQVIGPDSILFEGCDYNHWLITMDFPENLTAEQKVEEYVKTAAKIFGSIEEAKKRIYACSTTVYQGFQVECTEETSEKFKEIPGVVFVLPDSYIDPVNKQYGGDKYDNGTIIPRPPPITYRSRDFRPRNQRYENRGPMRGDAGNFGPPQNTSPQQNFGQPRGPAPQQNYSQPQNAPLQQNYGMHQNAPPQQNYAFRPPQQNYGMQQHAPPHQIYGMQQHAPPQQNYGYRPPQQNHGMPSQDPLHQPNYDQTQNIPPQNFIPKHNSGSLGMHSPTQQSYGPPGGIESRGPTTAPGGWDRNQGGRRDFPQGDQRGYTSADSGSFAGQSYTSSQGGTSSQGLGGAPGQEMGPAYGPNYPRHAEGQNFSDERKNYAGMGTADQGKH